MGLSHDPRRRSCRGIGDGTPHEETNATRETLADDRADQQAAREGQAWSVGWSERSIVPLKPANAGGGKGPWFKTSVESGRQPGDWR